MKTFIIILWTRFSKNTMRKEHRWLYYTTTVKYRKNIIKCMQISIVSYVRRTHFYRGGAKAWRYEGGVASFLTCWEGKKAPWNRQVSVHASKNFLFYFWQNILLVYKHIIFVCHFEIEKLLFKSETRDWMLHVVVFVQVYTISCS